MKHPLIRIGAGKIILDFYNNTDLNLKHRSIDELCQDLKKLYNISILEADEYDEPEKCVIAFCAVIPAHWEEKRAHQFIDDICRTVDQKSFARVTLEDWDIAPLES